MRVTIKEAKVVNLAVVYYGCLFVITARNTSGSIVGALKGMVLEDHSVYIHKFNADPQGQGIGTKLIEYLLALFPDREIGLHVKDGNPACYLYEKFGFESGWVEPDTEHQPMLRKARCFLTIVGGAGTRMPSPPSELKPLGGDLDVRLSFSVPVPTTQAGWKQQFTTPRWLSILETISEELWDLWGTHIPLDLGLTVNVGGQLWVVIFDFCGKPIKLVTHKIFPQEFCIGAVEM